MAAGMGAPHSSWKGLRQQIFIGGQARGWVLGVCPPGSSFLSTRGNNRFHLQSTVPRASRALTT